MNRIGVSTACLYPMDTEAALDELLDRGVKLVEIFFNSPSELRPEYVRGLASALSRNGARITAIHPFTSGYEPYLLFSQYERRFTDGLDLYRRYAETAAVLGAKFLIIHGDKVRSEIERPNFFERFAALCEASKPFQVHTLLENVNAFRGENPEFLRAFRQELGKDAGFVFDVKQAVRAGFSPFEVLESMEGHIRHVHLSDHNRQSDCLLPLCGDFETRKLFTQLAKAGYDGDFIVEVYRGAFSQVDEILRSVKKCETEISHLTKLV